MDKQTLPHEAQLPPTPAANHGSLKTLFWAISGAGVGALWAVVHYDGTEDWLGPMLVLAVSFGLVGAVLSLLVSKGCGT